MTSRFFIHILGLLICNFLHIMAMAKLCKEEADVCVVFHTLSKPVSTHTYSVSGSVMHCTS